MKRRLLTIVFYVLTCTVVRSQGKGVAFIEDKSWQDLLTMASEKNKLIFLDCYTTWCGPCKAMSKDVFPRPDVGSFMNEHFINTKFDMEKGEGIMLNKKYKKFIPGFPTYLLINAKGEVVHQVAGYNAADKFIGKINDGLQERTWIAYSNKYEAGQRDWKFIQTYLVLLEDAFQAATIKEVVAEAVQKITIPVITNDSFAYRVFRKYWTDAESPVLSSYLASPGIYRKYKAQEKEVNEWGGRLYKRAVDAYTKASLDSPKEYDADKAQKLVDDLLKLNVSSRENMVALMMLSQAVVKNDGNRFLELYNSAVQFGLLRYDKLLVGNWAKHFAEQTTDKAKLKQYLACVQIKEDNAFTSPEEIRNYAFILNKLGDTAKATEYFTKADKKEAEFREKYKSFIENK